MIKYGELDRGLSCYTKTEIHDDIPVEIYRRVIKAWIRANNNGLEWDVQKAASVLLFLAYTEGYIRTDKLNDNGQLALEWADKFLSQIDADTNRDVVRALSTA